MALRVVVKGLPELKAKFAQIGRDVAKQALRKGGSAGAKIAKQSIKALAPRGATGTLQRAIITKFVRENSDDNQAMYIVTARQGKRLQKGAAIGRKGKVRRASADAYYAKWVERGHRIVPRSARIGTKHGKAQYRETLRARRGRAGGMVPGRFFMARGFAASKERAVSGMVAAMRAEVDKVLG
jgi:HK97 gp10 family phage protein